MGGSQSRATTQVLTQNSELIRQNRELIEALTKQLNSAPPPSSTALASKPMVTKVASRVPGDDRKPRSSSAAGTPTVFISLHVDSTRELAEDLRLALQQAGISSWMCTDITPGMNFRSEIVKMASSCAVFVPLINEAWCNSGECEWEYNLVQRLNISKRTPEILPVFLQNIDSSDHWIVMALLTNKQSVFFNNNEAGESWNEVVKCVKPTTMTRRASDKTDKRNGFYQGYFFPTTKKGDAPPSRFTFNVHLAFTVNIDDTMSLAGWGHDSSGSFEFRDGKVGKEQEDGSRVVTVVKDYLGKYEIKGTLAENSSAEGLQAFKGIVEMNLVLKEDPEINLSGKWNLPAPHEQFNGFISLQRVVEFDDF